MLPNIGWKIVGGIWIHFRGFFTVVKPPWSKCLLICLADFSMCITDHCNDAEVTTAMLQILVRYLCRNTKCRVDFSCYLKRFIMDSRFLPSSRISGKIYNSVVSNKFMMWKGCCSPTLCRYLQTIIDFKWEKHGSLSSFRPPTGWRLHRFVWKAQRD